MRVCPSCGDEYEDDVDRCASCRVPLVAPGTDVAPDADALLGVFHPVMASEVLRVLDGRGIVHDALRLDAERVEVLVDRAWRDEVRAELTLGWGGLLQALEPEQRVAVSGAGGPQPGWHDAPQGAWVDDAGRLKVDPGGDEESLTDASRTLGPGLAAVGVVLLVFAWFVGGSDALVVLGVGLVGLGLLLPR